LIAAADAPEACAAFAHGSSLLAPIQKFIHLFFGDAMMPARRLHRANLAFINPLLQR